ncbi:aldehyde dehydrogenase [Arenibacterium halophilum]|uniref:Aldehyde dehydrogenase n=1 Tax=Arenibacterium halophilum TaxID=2583821 RepID=A0ABY2XEB0_9RHOB|nr:aldehyde dehydrogenase [Arenibacterium halophilum]TMV14988.1 aldehyde dehydrogenase [Arenibacterium halophilum]
MSLLAKEAGIPPVDQTQDLLIAGRPVAGDGPPLDVFNPATGALLGRVGTSSPAQVSAAIAAGREALIETGWSAFPPHERARVLSRAADEIERQADHLATLQMSENGKTRKESHAQAISAAGIFRYYAAVCECSEEAMPPARGDYFTMQVHEPVGVVAALTPWNSPLTMGAQKIAPALAAGNAVVLKAAETTSFVTLALGQCVVEAGLPQGLLSVIAGGRETAVALVEDPGIGLISFTGGTATGQSIARGAADRLVPLILELGGKSPHIVFADADLEAAAKAVANGIFGGTGQSCVAGSRLFVQASVADRFRALLIAAAGAMTLGPPSDPDSVIGPLSSFAHRDRVEAFVAAGLEAGGKVLFGGQRPEGDAFAEGAYYQPTIIGGLDNSATIAQEEIFGPVLCFMTFEDETSLIAAANDSAYGLAAGIWTQDYRRAWRVARAIEAGTVWINTYKQLSIAAPFGGFKLSGVGREKGLQGMRAYQQTKSVYWSTT